MDLSNLVTSPLNAKKPYWEVLQEHREFTASNPALANMPVSEFASHMNNVTGTNLYDAGVGPDNFLRRLSGRVDIGLHHVFGQQPGETEADLPYGTREIGQLLGAPREGFDLPKLVGGATKNLATTIGLGDETATKVGQVGESFPRLAHDILLSTGTRTGPWGLGALSALSTYGETGSKAKALVSGLTIPLFGKASELGGQQVLKILGSPKLKELYPDLLSKATALGGEEGLGELGEQLVPKNVWQGLAKFAGSQTGMFTTALGSELAGTVVDPDLSTSQKLYQAGEIFSPSSLVATAAGQLPFTALDLASPHNRPVRNIEKTVLPPLIESAKERIRAANEREELPQPSEGLLDSVINRLLNRPKVSSPTITPTTTSAELLGSVENPVSIDLKRPLRTSEGELDMGSAVETSKAIAEKVAVARGTPVNVDPMRVYSSLRQMEGEGKATKSTLLRNAALHALDTMYSDHENLTKVSPSYAALEQSRAELDKQEEVRKATEATITSKITVTLPNGNPNPDYDPEVHKRIALVSGDPDHRLEVGIHDRIYLQGRAGEPRPLDTSIIDSVRGLVPKTEVENPIQNAYDLERTTARLAELDKQISEAENGTLIEPTELERLRGERETLAEIQDTLESGGELEDKGKTRGKLLEALSTHKAYEAALNYEYPVDLSDPKSVGRFYARIKSAINQAEVGFLRNRAGEEFVKTPEGVTRTWPTREQAEAAIPTLPDEEGLTYYVPKRPQRDGTFPILAKRFYRTEPLDTSLGGVDHPRQLGEGLSFEPAEGAHPDYETGGISIGPFHQLEEFQKALPNNRNELVDQMHELNLQRDPAVREAHKLMLAQNVIDWLVNLPPAEIVRVLRNEIGPTPTGREARVQEPAKIKARVIKLIEFLRDGGDLKLTFVPVKGRLKVRPQGDLEAFNKYLGELGWSKTQDLVTPHVQGLTLFEQFHILTKLIKQEFVRPGKNLDFRERPRGDFGFYPPGFVDDIETKLYVDPQAYPTGLIGSSRKEWGSYSTNPDDPVVLKMTDRNGKEIRFEGGDNVLKTAIVKATKGQLTMPASKWVALLKDFAPDADPRLMEVLTSFVSHKFGGDIPVGFAVARDPSSKGWYHFDRDLMQGTGILLSPFTPDLTGRRVAKLDAPEQILTHFVDELAHAHTVFAYRTDASVKAEVDQMFKYVKDYVDSAKSVGALGKFTDSSFYSLSRPEEMLSGMFRDWRLHELLKSIPDPFPAIKTRSLYEKLVDIFRRIFSKFVGDDAAGTMLGRLSELTSRTMEVQMQMKGLGHSGDIYGALERVPGKKPSTDLIYSPRAKPVEKGPEPTQVYPLDFPSTQPESVSPDTGATAVPGVRPMGVQEKLQGLGVPPAYRALMEWKGAKLALTKAETEFAGVVKTAGMLLDDSRFLKAKQNLEEAKVREQTTKELSDKSNKPVKDEKGEVMFSRIDPTPLLDSMSASSLYRTEDPDGIWHKPFSQDHFERTFGPIVGDKLRLERQGGQLGYKISHVDLNNITERDLAQAPVPQVKPYAPTIFETLKSLFRKEGASDQTAEAQSSYLLNIAALLKGTDEATWGKVSNENQLLGIAWMPEKFAGLSEGPPTLLAKEQVILHESAHLAGFYEDNLQLAPDVRQAVRQVNRVFNELTSDQRLRLITDMTNLSRQAAGGGLYEASLTQPDEFAAEFMAHVGGSIMNVPKPSALTRDFMRFSPDDMSTLIMRNAFRREQALDKLKDYLTRMRIPTNNPQPLLKAVDKLVTAFKSIAREATDIAVDQAEFYRMRAMYPDRYAGLLRQAAANLDAEAPTRPGTPAPKLSGEVLESKVTDLFKDVAEHFEYPRDGRFSKKPSVWMRTIAQFAQFAEQFPIARPFYDMLASAQGLERTAIIEMQVAGAGAWTGNKLLDDRRTKNYGVFIRNEKLRETFSAMQLDIQTELDSRFSTAMKAAEGDIMQIAPQQVQFKTPEFMDALYRKYQVINPKDRAILDTIFTGTTNQIKLTGLKIIQSHVMALKTIGAKSISKSLKLPVDQSREASELAYRAIELQNDPNANLQEAMDTATKYQQMVPDSNTQAKVYQLFENGQERIAKLERFLALRMESFASERQFGDYGLWWKDNEGKLVRKFFKSEDQMQGFIKRENVTPIKQIYPQDKNFGVNDELFSTLNEFHDRTMEKLTDLLGETEAKKLSSVLDVATELRDALSARDVLKATAPRKGGSSRDYLDMFDTHQNYISSVITAAKTRQMRLEADLLLDQPQFDNEPILKNYLQQHLQAVLKPDTKVGNAISQINFLYYIGGNLSTMIQEPFQQLSALAPILTQHGATVKDGFGLIIKANKMWLESKLNKNKYKDPEIAALIERAGKEGVVDQGIFSELDHNEDLSLMNRMRQAGGLKEWDTFDMLKNRLYQVATLARRFYGQVPAYNSEIAVIASYLHAKAQGLSGEAAYSQARFLKEQAMFGGGKINRPGLFAPDNWLTQGNRSAAQIMWSLQSYSSSMMTIMGNLIKQSFTKGLTPAQSTQVRKAAVQMLGTQFVLAGTLGMPFVQLGIIALQKLFPDENIELMVRTALNQVEGDDKAMGGFMSSMMTTGLPSAFNYGPDVGSRLAISGTMGVSPYGGASLDNIIGPTASLVKNVFKGMQAGVQGEPIKTVQSLMPVSFQRVWKTLEEGSAFKSNRGDILADDLTLPEVLGRAVGFNPERISKLRAADNLAKLSQDAASHEQASWIERQVESLQAGEDSKVHQEVVQRAVEQKRKPQELARLIAQKVEEKTMPVDTRAFGDRRTLADQKRLRDVAGEQAQGPSYQARVQLQRSLAQRMGIPLAAPALRSVRRASALDQLLGLYPHLTKTQAEAILARTSTVGEFPE